MRLEYSSHMSQGWSEFIAVDPAVGSMCERMIVYLLLRMDNVYRK